MRVQDSLELKKNIYQLLREGNIEAAEELTLKGMEDDLNNADYEQILKILKFWNNRKELFEFREHNGKKLFSEWDRFADFCEKNSIDNKKALLSIKDFVFRKIVDLLIDSYKLSPVPERETLVLLGQSFHEIGLTEKAVETLEYAMTLSREESDVRIYVLLGNLYAAAGDKDLSMVMFNEAFFRFPQQVDLGMVDHVLIRKLGQMAREDGFRDNEVLEWIPVYGYLFDVLTARRKLEYKDYVDLKEKITDYEKNLKVDKKAVNVIVARLINYYFWILDYYIYEVRAYGPAENVTRRTLGLISTAQIDERVREKLSGRANGLFKKLLKDKYVHSFRNENTPAPSRKMSGI